MKVADCMMRKVFTLRDDKMLIVAKEIMEWAHVRHVPVVDAIGDLVGMVSQRDLLSASVASVGTRMTQEERRRHLWGIPLQKVMRKPVITIGPSDSIEMAARKMRLRKISCLPVVERRKLVGILSAHDLLRVVEVLLSVSPEPVLPGVRR